MDKLINLSIIVSVYNEEQCLQVFYDRLILFINKIDTEIIFVNDGSFDNSFNALKDIQSNNPNITIINLSRNFGHEAAMLAGIDNAHGDSILCIDADLQHPPKIIPQLIEEAKNGADIVLAKRDVSKNDSYIINIFSRLFYYLINKLSSIKFEANVSDYFLISKKLQYILKTEYRERSRFLRGFIQDIGFKKVIVRYDAQKRIHGESKYDFMSLIKLSFNALIAFSKKPLYLGIYLGVVFGLFSFFVTIYSIVMRCTSQVPPGYTTLIVIISLLFSVHFFLLGIIGIYIGFLFDEQKKRPIYIIDKIL